MREATTTVAGPIAQQPVAGSPLPRQPRPPQRAATALPRNTRAPGSAAINGTLVQTGGMVLLAVTALRLAFRRPVKWVPNLIDEAYLLVVRCSFPLSVAVFAFGFSTIGVEAGGVFKALGATDRAGGIFITGAVREVATWATAMVVAGVGGTAICADLGARKIREELDALSVLGVNPVKELVVPRMFALAVITPLLNLVGVLFILISGFAVMSLLFNVSPAAFHASLAANFTPVELFGSVLKTTIFGIIIAVVCCYKGLNVSGGPQGVGRAVNQAVVISFAALWIFNYAFTSVLLAQFPALQGLR
jgi:phospholipid/cholesterol/gamma-HCH transport system permease protein